ncbi:MAG TPA: MazG family protein, partial [Micromonosporaceae bacterium]|nr:MazG family protein [Micromonosporaceae bacterium]
MAGRIVFLVTSPRLPAGLMTAAAWDLVRANPVLTAADGEQAAAVRRAGGTVTVTERGVDDLLDAVAQHETVVWLAGPAGDAPMARTLGLRLARDPSVAEMTVAYGSWDPTGARLLDVVAVMDRLASPGGDPWKRQQTHRSLATYMIEEAYEAVDAIEADDLDALRDELGDVLLQVVLHARLAEDLPDGQAWTIDEVAGGLVDKMVRRNPHVFGDANVETVQAITEQWEQIKRAERAGRGVMDGIVVGQPALSLAAKIQTRAARAGLALDDDTDRSRADLGERLWALVAEATAAGLDAEAELRRVALAHLRSAAGAGSGGAGSGGAGSGGAGSGGAASGGAASGGAASGGA